MRRYIAAELSRNFKRSYFWGLTFIISILGLVMNTMMSANGLENSFLVNLQILPQMFTTGIFLIVMFVDMVTMEEFKNGTIKNVVGSGLSRDKIVLGKVITTGILGGISALIIILVFVLSGYLLLEINNMDLLLTGLRELSNQVAVVIPLWIGASVVLTFFVFLIERSFVASFAYYAFVGLLPNVLKLLSTILNKPRLLKIKEIFSITDAINNMIFESGNMANIRHGILLALGYIVVFTVLSILVFRKKDI